MPKRANFTPKNTPYGWRINIPKNLSESGKRERYFYPTRDKASEAATSFRKKLTEHGSTAKAISPTLAAQAIAAEKLLEPYGITILDACSRIAAIEAKNKASVTVERATAAFTEAKEGLSDKQTQAIKGMVMPLVRDFSERMMSSITGADLAGHLARHVKAASYHNSRLRVLTTFWRWCAHPSRRWCDPEVLEHVERRDEKAGEIGVLTAKEAATLLATAKQYYPECIPGYAIAIFTGIRQAEIDRLQPKDITSEGINVPIAANAKSNRRRFIEMPKPLAAWLKKYPVGKTVLPSNWRRKDQHIRRLAGWRVWSDKVEPRKAPREVPAWPQNALRHTAASVALALGKPIETLIFEHGHAEGVTTLKAHYIGRMTKKEAEAIWALRPATS